MKRLGMVMLAVLLSITCISIASAQDARSSSPGGEGEIFEIKISGAKTIPFEGQVISHDADCHCFEVKTSTGIITLDDDYTKFREEYNRLKGLKIGSDINGEYKTVDRVNYAIWIAYK